MTSVEAGYRNSLKITVPEFPKKMSLWIENKNFPAVNIMNKEEDQILFELTSTSSGVISHTGIIQ